jgi:hypothetical protein
MVNTPEVALPCPYRKVCPEVLKSGHCLGDDPDEGEWLPMEGFMTDKVTGDIACLDWDVIVPKPPNAFTPQAEIFTPQGE